MLILLSDEFFGRPGDNASIIWPPKVQTVGMYIDVFADRRMQLHDSFFMVEEHVLDGAHFFPCGAGFAFLIAGRYADMVPSEAVGGNNAEGTVVYEDFEDPVSGVTVCSVDSQFIVFETVFV